MHPPSWATLLPVDCTSIRSSFLTAPAALVELEGYALEEHTVQTADGYILNIYRMPCARAGCTSAANSRR